MYITEIGSDAHLSTTYPVFRALFNDGLVAEEYFVQCLPAVLFGKECTAASLVSSKRRWDLLGTMPMRASLSVSQAEGWPVDATNEQTSYESMSRFPCWKNATQRSTFRRTAV
jgi:hypothetical protein